MLSLKEPSSFVLSVEPDPLNMGLRARTSGLRAGVGGQAAALGMLVRRTPVHQALRRAFVQLQRSSAVVITISDISQKASPCKGMADSGYSPATGTCSASIPCRAFCTQPGFCSGCISLSLGSLSTCLAIFIPCQIFASFETFCPPARWIEIGTRTGEKSK